jgi:hypothetical protein
MVAQEDRYKDALAKIAELALAASNGGPTSNGRSTDIRGAAAGNGGRRAAAEFVGCQIKPLPDRLTEPAARMATKINPINAPMRQPVRGASAVPTPLSIAVSTARYWGPAAREMTVSFMDTKDTALRKRILSHMNAWASVCGISFVETSGVGQVRIAREAEGYYSYLGTDVTLIPEDRQTMNLEAFGMDTPDSEFYRVVRHETGHTLGFPHEHMRTELVARIDPDKAYPFFLKTQGWDKATVDAQVLTPLDESTILGTPVEDDSVMCYQLAGSITFDGKPIPGGTDITPTDYAFAATIYPKADGGATASPGRGAQAGRTPREVQDDWSRADDVLLPI